MKSSNKIQSWLSSLTFASAAVVMSGVTASAATITWKNTPAVGNFNVGANWDTGNVPGALDVADIAKINNAGTTLGATTISYLTGNNFSFTTMELAANTALSNNRAVFDQSGGTLSLVNLRIGLAASGASKSPEYHIGGGTLNVTGTWSFGDGSAIKFLASGGTVNYSGGAFLFGNNGVAHEVTLTNGAAINYSSSSQITLGGGGNAAGIAKLSLANTSTFTASNVSTILMGNDGTKGNFITLADSAAFSAPLATIALGQFTGSVTVPTTAAGTINLSGTSSFKVKILKTGGNNAGNLQWGVVNLTGGTLEAESLQTGASTVTPDSTHNVLNADGGTLKASIGSANFFGGVFVNLLAGGLKFNTNANDVSITNVLSGVGGLTKQGDGTLTLSNVNTYTGNTVVSAGILSLSTASLSDAGTVTIANGAILNLSHGGQDQVTKIILNGVEKTTAGTYGAIGSGAIFESEFFSGSGFLRIGPASPGRNLTWTGVESTFWEAAGGLNFTTNGVDSVAFSYNDNVTFNDSSAVNAVDLFGMVYPGSVIFNGTLPYSVAGSGGIAGSTGIVVNNTSTVSLGGSASAFTGPISLNAGKLIALDNKSFGTSSGITIASGAQIDLSGKALGPIYTFTLNGPGPAGSGAIVNGGADILSSTGVKNLVLNADSVVGNDGGRLDICNGGVLTGNSHTLTKAGNNGMALRGSGSASPINIIAAGGGIWAEGTDAFGGATGTLTVKSGARAGSFGARTMNNATTIESGGMINNLGNGKGIWSGALALAGNVVFEGGATAPDQIDITGTVTGTANITKQGTALVTITHPTYVGNTTVAGGQLSVLNPEFADSGSVSIATAGTLSLPHGLNDTVSTLFLDGVQVAAGTYGATDNLTAQFTTDRIVGAGKLVVTNGPVVAGAFDIWANANITNPAYSALKGRLDDPDGDGLTNINEFLYGSNPQSGSGSLTELVTSGTNLIVRWNERTTGATYTLQESATLAEIPWPTSAVTPVVAGDQTGVPTDYTRKQATIPINSARKFVRVFGVEN
ncbi:MAG: autotransporter-associated beta strand repeat-containing protein [Luteolibacter sp.]